ncbi:hypothetical protein [Billgrantia desiderata]|uniref:hypothetical protein n=1 Tax=Billgrantia desiderata TaxID=52021 RepID=UPI001F169DBB|nr:hypothetical protein [Halomonas desiderata]MCE8012891.1 hypothetical protein [Halomonas desiderata]
MPDYAKIPRRLHVLRALTDHLRTIAPDNGYQFDLSGAVFRGRNHFGDGDPLPMVSILQSPRPLEGLPPPGNSAVHHGPLELLVQGFAVDDPEHPTDPAEVLMADVKQALGELVKRIRDSRNMAWEGITRVSIGPGICRPPDGEISSVAYFWLSVTVEFTENATDPYAVPAA